MFDSICFCRFVHQTIEMDIAGNIEKLKKELDERICLVAVSKTKPNEDILEAYSTGHRVFGENKVQDLVKKAEELPNDIQWHFIGHPQTNKVKYIAPFISLIHGVDSIKLLKMIDKEGKKNDRVINCLLQFHIAEEQTKFGLNLAEAQSILESPEFTALEHVRVVGIMGMATYTDDDEQIRKEFKGLMSVFNSLKETYFAEDELFTEISMGMSGDYEIAIEEGSTMIRVGSSIFGERVYH